MLIIWNPQKPQRVAQNSFARHVRPTGAYLRPLFFSKAVEQACDTV